MRRTWNMLLALVLPALLTAGPTSLARADKVSGGKTGPLQKQLEQLDASLQKAFEKFGDDIRSLRKDLKAANEERGQGQEKLRAALEKITFLEQSVAEVKGQMEAMKKRAGSTVALYPPTEKDSLEEIRVRLSQIERLLVRPPAPARIALYPPTTEAVDTQEQKIGKVKHQLHQLDSLAKEGFANLHEELSTLSREVRSCKEDRTEALLRFQSALSTVRSLQPQLAEMKGELEGLRSRASGRVSLYPAEEKVTLDDIRARLEQIEHGLTRAQTPAYVSLYPTGRVGRVVLVNTYAEDLTFTLNGRSYRVAPGSSLPLDSQPAGALTYEVISPTWGLRDRVTTNLAPNETLTLTAR